MKAAGLNGKRKITGPFDVFLAAGEWSYLCVLQSFNAALRGTAWTAQLVETLCIEWVKGRSRKWQEGRKEGEKRKERVTAGATSPRCTQNWSINGYWSVNMVNITNASSSLFIRTPSWVVGLCTLRLKWHNHKIQKSISTVNSRSVVVSLVQHLQPSTCNWILASLVEKKQWTSFLGTKDEGEIFFIPTVMTRSIAPSLCGAAYHGNLAKLITLSGSLC